MAATQADPVEEEENEDSMNNIHSRIVDACLVMATKFSYVDGGHHHVNNMYFRWCMPFVILLWDQYLFICNMQHGSTMVEFVCVTCESSNIFMIFICKMVVLLPTNVHITYSS